MIDWLQTVTQQMQKWIKNTCFVPNAAPPLSSLATSMTSSHGLFRGKSLNLRV